MGVVVPTLSTTLALAVVASVVALDLTTWLVFRLDKGRARSQRWRVPERTLLALTLVGGLGALAGMYAHRRRHKTRVARFVVTAWLAAAARLAALGWLAAGGQ